MEFLLFLWMYPSTDRLKYFHFLEQFLVQFQANTFTRSLKAFIESYQGNNIAVTMGEDFQFQAAQVNLKNMDALIR